MSTSYLSAQPNRGLYPCVREAAKNKNSLQFFWDTAVHDKILTATISSMRLRLWCTNRGKSVFSQTLTPAREQPWSKWEFCDWLLLFESRLDLIGCVTQQNRNTLKLLHQWLYIFNPFLPEFILIPAEPLNARDKMAVPGRYPKWTRNANSSAFFRPKP